MTYHKERLKELMVACERLSRERGLIASSLSPELGELLQKRTDDYTYNFLASRLLSQCDLVRKAELEYSHAQTNLAGRIRELLDYIESQ